MPDTIAERVARGAELLDQNWPKWEAKISLDTLDLYDPCGCVVGQIYGFYAFGCLSLGVRAEGNQNNTFDHGFFAGKGVEAGPLADEWRRVIRERLEATNA